MGLQKQHRPIISLLSLGILGFATPILLPLPGQAVDTPSSSPSGGAPSRTASGAPKRNNGCIAELFDLDGDGTHETLTPMTVLAPTDNVTATLDPQPTLFVYLPKTNADEVQIVIDERTPSNHADRSYDYQEVWFQEGLAVPHSVAQGPRIVQYQLEGVMLEPGKTYEWQLSLLCDGQVPAKGTVKGLVTCQNGCTVTIDTPAANQQHWNEQLRFTAEHRTDEPEQWQRLLESQGLGCFKDVPFADETDVTFTLADDPQCFVD